MLVHKAFVAQLSTLLPSQIVHTVSCLRNNLYFPSSSLEQVSNSMLPLLCRPQCLIAVALNSMKLSSLKLHRKGSCPIQRLSRAIINNRVNCRFGYHPESVLAGLNEMLVPVINTADAMITKKDSPRHPSIDLCDRTSNSQTPL